MTGNRARERERHAAKGPGPGVEPRSTAEPRHMGRTRHQPSQAAPCGLIFKKKGTALCGDTDSPAAGGQMMLFFWLLKCDGGVDRGLDWGVGLIRSVTLSRFVRVDIRPPFFTLSSFLSIVFAPIQTNKLAFSHSRYIFLIPVFLNHFSHPPSSPVPPSCLSLRLSDRAYQQQNKQAHCVVREPSGCREEACFFKTWIGYPFTGEMGLAGRLNASRQHGCGWNGDRQRH